MLLYVHGLTVFAVMFDFTAKLVFLFKRKHFALLPHFHLSQPLRSQSSWLLA